MTHPVLTALGLGDTESGTYLGNGEWSKTSDAGVLEPVNPTDGERARRACRPPRRPTTTRSSSAPRPRSRSGARPRPRAAAKPIRLCADALRTHKDALGSLVALEMGKSKPEGDGEVQEMIDIGEFAVGLSRQLYGLTMHSERPGHRMYEQWHPIGIVGIISRVQLPGRGVGVECVRRRGVRRHRDLEAVAEDAAVGDRRDEDLQRGAAARAASRTSSSCSTMPAPSSRQAFVDDKRIALISFTGSTKVGRMVGERVARRMGRSPAGTGRQQRDHRRRNRRPEAGDPGDRVRRGRHRRPALHHHAPPVRARIDLRRRAGQAGRRLQAGREEDRRPDRSGQPDGPAQQPRRACRRYLDAVEKAKAAGGKVETGGAAIEGKGNFVLPTIVTGLTNDAEVVQTETFAPILYVMKYHDARRGHRACRTPCRRACRRRSSPRT